MATKKKKTPRVSGGVNEAFSRLPGPLPTSCSGVSSDDAKLDVVEILTEDALDLGEPRWDDAKAKAMSPKDRRAYQAAADAAYSGQNERQAWLAEMMRAAVKQGPGRARLAEIVRTAPHPIARQIAADTLLANAPTTAELRAISSLLDVAGDPNALQQVHRRGARAILLLDRAAGYDALVAKAGSGCVLLGLVDTAPAIDPRWLQPLLSVVEGKDLGAAFSAMTVLTKLEPDPRMVHAVITHFGPVPEKAFYSQQALSLLERCGDARAVPYLCAALSKTSYWNIALDALRHVGAPVAVHEIRRWRASRDLPANAGWPGLAMADDVIQYLESRGPIPDEPPTAPTPPGPRQRRKLHAPPKVVLPKAETPEEQRAHLVAVLEEQRLAHHADQLIRNAIAIYPRRTKDGLLRVGGSKMGGCPDLPRGERWPRMGDNFFGFLAQIDLAEVAALDLDALLPRKGLLSLFVMDELEGGYLEHALVLHIEDTSALLRAEVPLDFDRRPPETVIREPYAACALTFRTRLTLPSASNARVAEILSEAELRRYESLEWHGGDENQLLGWRDQGYDETPTGTRLLFQCTSDDQAVMEWGDVETLSLLIGERDLRAGSFGAVRAQVGD